MKKSISFLLMLVLTSGIVLAQPHRHRHWPSYYEPAPISLPEYETLYTTVEKQSNDYRKIQILEHAFAFNYFYSSQIAGLIGLLHFESSMLKMAKQGWLKVYDPANYYQVMDQLSFSSSRRDLHDFMKRYIPEIQQYIRFQLMEITLPGRCVRPTFSQPLSESAASHLKATVMQWLVLQPGIIC